MKNLDAALDYARRGWPVFPCKPGTKVPLGSLVPRGFKDATTDENLIRFWWAREPAPNIGIPTGSATFDVLDVDVTASESGFSTLATLSPRPLSEELVGPYQDTPRGGRHYLFTGGAMRNSAKRLPGIDWRGEGGYVVVSPSVVEGRQYQWGNEGAEIGKVPEWILRALEMKDRPKLVFETDPEDGFSELAMMGGPIPEGRRDDTLFRRGCSLQGNGIADETIIQMLQADNRMLCQPPLLASQVEKICRQVLAYPKGNPLTDKDIEKANSQRLDQNRMEVLELPEEREKAMHLVSELLGIPIHHLEATGLAGEHFVLRLEDGSELVVGDSKAFTNPGRFREVVVASGRPYWVNSITPKRWVEVVRLLQIHREIVDSDTETKAEMLSSILPQYLNPARGELVSWEDREVGIPGRRPLAAERSGYLVNGGHIRTFIRQEFKLDWTLREVADALKDIGGKQQRISSGHAGKVGQARYWLLDGKGDA